MGMSFMRNIEEPTVRFSLITFFLLQSHHLFIIPVTSYTPADKFSINCGSSSDSYTFSDNRTWESDDHSKLVSLGHNGNISILSEAAQVSAPLESVPYATARLSHSEFTYSFQVTEGPKFVRLFFYPAAYSNFDRSDALFSVKAGHYTLLKDFNASLTADNDDDPEAKVFREYCVNVEPGHRLNITFTPSANHPGAYAFINGIEVVAMPTDLYYKKADDPAPMKVVDEGNRIQVDDGTALEMVYRISVGGGEILAAQDTGMLRDWHDVTTGDGYEVMQTLQDLKGNDFDAKLRYQNDLLREAAPKEVYFNAKTTKDKMTWEFKVDSMFAYMIRLHFCELDQTVQKGERVFQVFIADKLAEPQVDVVAGWQGDSQVPVYKDYAVLLKRGKLKRQTLSIKLQRLPKSKHDVLLNGIEIFKISDPSDNLGGPNPDPTFSPAKPSKISMKNAKAAMVIVIPCAIVFAIVLSLIVFLICWRKTRGAGNRTAEESLDLCRKFSIAEIRAATDNFDKASIIGCGGFGMVYKGQFNKGKTSTSAAIKRLKPNSEQGVGEFKTEIRMLSQFRHPHLVDLIGYCNDDEEMMLVYEFMARGTLRDHLIEPVKQPLSWKQRLEICIGAAKALLYLHSNNGENKQSVIHRDVKSTNILLDEAWVAKVSDFGLSKIGPDGLSRSHVTTDVKGSVGYIDPEYYETQQLTARSDVYSFGVVLLEVLCGKPHIFRSAEKQTESLADWVKKCYEKGVIGEVVDPSLKGIVTTQCVNKFVQIALACLRDNGKLRPSMRDVVRGLENMLKTQGRMEVEILRDVVGKANSEDKTSLAKITEDEESGVQFSMSCGSTTTESKCTITSEEEQALVPAVFSELANPTAR